MKRISCKSIRLRYIMVIVILAVLLAIGFVMRSPMMTQISGNNVKLSGLKMDKNGTLHFSADIQSGNWFDYSGMEYDTRWIEDETGTKEKAIVCCLYKKFELGGNNGQRTIPIEITDLAEMEDISAVYLGRDENKVLIWER